MPKQEFPQDKMLTQQSFQSQEDEIDLRELASAIWQGKWVIICITAIFAVSSVFYTLSIPDEYKATALLAPASTSNGSSLSKLASQYGGLATLAGLSLGGSDGNDKVVIGVEILKAWSFLEEFILDNNLQVEVFATRGWNKATNSLIIDPEVYNVEKKQWIRDFDPSIGESAEPSSWELYEKIKDRITIIQDEETGLIHLSVEFYSPLIAKVWVDRLVKAINQDMQLKDRDEAVKSIKYLKQKIEETAVADMQAVFYQLIEEQTKTLMLAEVNDEYVFKTISEARIAEEKSKPRRALIVVIATFFGGLFSLIVVLIRLNFNRG